MKALNDYIIIRKDDSGFVTKSGILIPDFGTGGNKADGAPFTGVVVSVGDCVKGRYTEGERVVYNDMCSPYQIEDDNGLLLAIRETDVAAVLNT